MFRQLKDELTGVYWSFIYTSIKCCFSEHKDVICKLTRRPFTWNNLNDQPTRYRRSWKLPGWCWPITEVQQLSVKGKGRCTSPATRRRCLQIMSYYTCPDTPAQVFLSITPLLSLQVNSKHSQTKEQREILLIYTPDWEEYSLLFYSTFTCWAFIRCFCPKWFTISTSVMRKKPQHVTMQGTDDWAEGDSTCWCLVTKTGIKISFII